MDTPANIIERQRRLLRMEYEEEKASFMKIADRTGLVRLRERGRAWWPLRIGRTYYNSLNRRVVEIERTDDYDPEAEHEFEYGKPVVFFTAGNDPGTTPRLLFGGTVNFVDGGRMVVAIIENASVSALDVQGGITGVMLSFDETSFRTMFDALERVASGKGRPAELNDLICNSRLRCGELSAAPIGIPYLNSSQESAVNKVLRAKDIAIVHGPPGTGKTTTLVEAIYETLRRESRVMVCAQSNMAVDWISEKLMERGLNVLRIGNPARVNDAMLSSTYERRFEAHPDYPQLWSIRKAIREIRSSRGHTEARHQKLDRLKSRAQELEIRINADVLGSPHVVACTLVGSASHLLEGMRFETVFIDEAAQALEAACWIPMRRASRMILAGDHCQLPPTVKCVEAMRGGLGRSLMERIVENHPECVTLLSTQYRMNREIMQFSSEYFYGNTVKAATEVENRGILDLDTPIEWIDTAEFEAKAAAEETPEEEDRTFTEELAGENFGRINRAEARLTMEILRLYIERIGKDRVIDERIDFGLISPYRAQVRYIRSLLRSSSWSRPFRKQISVNTVDGFQGQERDVIVISLVRNNAAGQIGFLRDLRRMNVAMTRARMKLLIIGDAGTLTKAHPFYRKLKEYIENINNETE